MARNGKLHLKTRPDGYGYIYGVWQDGEHSIRVDIMPPRAHWVGDMMLPDRPPHQTDWVVYADGEEIARVQAENVMGLEGALRALPAPLAAKSMPDDNEINDKPLTFLRALRCPEYGLLVVGGGAVADGGVFGERAAEIHRAVACCAAGRGRARVVEDGRSVDAQHFRGRLRHLSHRHCDALAVGHYAMQ